MKDTPGEVVGLIRAQECPSASGQSPDRAGGPGPWVMGWGLRVRLGHPAAGGRGQLEGNRATLASSGLYLSAPTSMSHLAV